jgi:hypothetical protein
MKRYSRSNLLTFSALSAFISTNNAQTTTIAPEASTITASTAPLDACDSSQTILQSECDPSQCETYCNLYGSTYLNDKCCKHAGVNANLLAFEESDIWIPRIDEYHKCTGANIKLQYVVGGEDYMADALIADVGLNHREDTGEGIYDAYIVQAPWLPPVYMGLKSLSQYIKENDEYIRFTDINQASRSAVSFEGEVQALPLDADYIAMGWRQDVFTKHADEYKKKYNEELKVPTTIDELVDVSEKLNGFDHNGDGVPDWGFCLTPQTNYFNAFVAPVFQTHLRECSTSSDGVVTCNRGAFTGQNIFFDADTFEPLIFNVSYLDLTGPLLGLCIDLTIAFCCSFHSFRMGSNTLSRHTGGLSAVPTAKKRVLMEANVIARLRSPRVVSQHHHDVNNLVYVTCTHCPSLCQSRLCGCYFNARYSD